jgi:hypothetical protein
MHIIVANVNHEVDAADANHEVVDAANQSGSCTHANQF